MTVGVNKKMAAYCILCEKTFASAFNLIQHNLIHSKERPFACPICALTFTQKSNMKVHVKRKHSQYLKSITTLPAAPINKADLPIVIKSYFCQFCKKVLSSYSQLRRHLSLHNQELYKCTKAECGEEFKAVNDYLNHAAIHGINTPAKQHQNQEKQKCVKCHRIFRTAASFQKHLATESHSHPCPFCKVTCPSERYLRKHLIGHTLLKCEQCHREFRSLRSLREHRSLHRVSNLLTCDLCGMRFGSRYRLNRHIGLHFDKKLACPYSERYGCEKMFYRRDKLNDHVKSHQEEDVTNIEILKISDVKFPVTNVEIIRVDDAPQTMLPNLSADDC